MASVSRETVTTENARTIVATFFVPDGGAKASVLIAPAMGVQQGYYAAFAHWLCGQGYAVATFDYSGIGSSHNGDLRTLDVTVTDWARFDCDAMLAAIAARAPGKSLYWVGHSLGGQILGLLPDRSCIAKAVTIAAGSGYWASLRLRAAATSLWLWYVVTPPAVRFCGYFPGRRLRKVGDLPGGVMRQWRRWCLDPQYAAGAEGPAVRAGFAAVDTPITSLAFADDEMMSARSIAELHGLYANAPRVMRWISPGEIGARRIGHFGFFRERFESSLWRNYLLPELQ